MVKKASLIIVSMLIGVGITFIAYEYYLQNYYAYLDEVYSQLESSSESAFNDLEPTASMFVQIHNAIIIHDAMKKGLIEENDRNRLAAIFMTRSCINYEDDNNKELAEKMCLIASQDLSLWDMEIEFLTFKSVLIEKRNQMLITRDSNKSLKNGTPETGAP